jgi:hypothetical protein
MCRLCVSTVRDGRAGLESFNRRVASIAKFTSEMPRFRKVVLIMGKYLIGAVTADNANAGIAPR